jgi:Holliday junction resolvase RusA-like endonuclease
MIKLPLPPSLNAMYRTKKNFYGIYKTDEAESWEDEVRWKLSRRKKLSGKIKMGIDMFLKRDRDIDSCLKAILDAFEGILYDNDRQVFDLHVSKYFDKANPRVEISVMEEER